MLFAQELLKNLYRRHHLEDAPSRRELIFQLMEEVSSKGHGCQSCQGFCCTFENNSMQVDPLQALELLVFIETNFDNDIWLRINDTIERYRLDRLIPTQNNQFLRRYYTCPFYLHHNKGCSISRKAKPYGCLAFNALEANVSTPGFCASSQGTLKRREELYDEQERQANLDLIGSLDLYWSKLPMPLALREVKRKIQHIFEDPPQEA